MYPYCEGFEGDPAANTLPANQRLEEPSRNYYPILLKCLHMYAHTGTYGNGGYYHIYDIILVYLT